MRHKIKPIYLIIIDAIYRGHNLIVHDPVTAILFCTRSVNIVIVVNLILFFLSEDFIFGSFCLQLGFGYRSNQILIERSTIALYYSSCICGYIGATAMSHATAVIITRGSFGHLFKETRAKKYPQRNFGSSLICDLGVSSPDTLRLRTTLNLI